MPRGLVPWPDHGWGTARRASGGAVVHAGRMILATCVPARADGIDDRAAQGAA
ncbi:hypothetical protein M768_20025 [Cellulosimicrobium cellulans F16]|uniref:Uncharacterized protein n=1 Tax=Cellulosimicrobium cellulans F16 TaxID=1350482 RepID=A0A0M0F5V9_CELCE|nr:hypothetical protein M768_20025 [Cellulosimicrobium cellulans F16]